MALLKSYSPIRNSTRSIIHPESPPQPRRTIIVSYRAAYAYPIFIKNRENSPEKYARLVKGHEVPVVRFTRDEFPIPKYKDDIISLYQLQELSREKPSKRNPRVSAKLKSLSRGKTGRLTNTIKATREWPGCTSGWKRRSPKVAYSRYG